MSDDIKVPDESAGSGPAVATDEIGGRHYQLFKPAFGAADSATLVDPTNGLPVDPKTLPPGASTETTLAALKAVADTIATAAAAIQAAAEALNGKTTAVNTGAIAGTVALDAGSLAALETVTANTGLAQPLTDTQLRAAAVPVSAAALPLPAGAATEATLGAINTDLGDQADATAGSDAGSFSLIALFKRLLGKTPASGQATMANSSPVVIASDQAAIPITGSISANTDFWVSVMRALEAFTEGVFIDPTSGRLRVVIDALGGAQTLGTVSTVNSVTTCSILTSVSQVAGVPANSFIYDSIDTAWANCIRGRIQ